MQKKHKSTQSDRSWFPDSSRLTFFSGQRLIVAPPNGRQTTTLMNSPQKAGLPVPSPVGRYIAYATFVPRPRNIRSDLTFWVGTEIWTVPADDTSGPKQITLPSEGTTYDLNWAGNTTLVFDRIADTLFYSHASLWAVAVAK
jgi:Tol biopolymer transport system component